MTSVSVAGLDAARYVASPIASDDASVLEFMFGEYARALLEIGLLQIDPAPIETGASLDKLLDQPISWPAAWTLELAQLERAITRSLDPAHVSDALVAVLLQLASHGLIDECELRLESEQPLFFGHLRLPTAREVVFRATSVGAEIELRAQGRAPTRLDLERTDVGVWRGAEPLDQVVWFGGHQISLRTTGQRGDFPIPADQRLLSVDALAGNRAFSAAAALIEECSPSFAPWIKAAVHTIVPLDASHRPAMSATVEEYPGLVFLSLPLNPSEVAARLVHEASHQYYFALERLAALHDGSDQELYFSPMKGRDRPIEMILFAFHAFGNGVLHDRNLFELRHASAIDAATLENWMAQVRTLTSHLRRTQALTPMGEELWRSLAAVLFAATPA